MTIETAAATASSGSLNARGTPPPSDVQRATAARLSDSRGVLGESRWDVAPWRWGVWVV